MLFDFSQVVQFCDMFFHSSEILVIYLNNLCCFRVLCNMFVLSCGNSPEDCFVSFWGVTHVLSLILEHSTPMSKPAAPGLTSPRALCSRVLQASSTSEGVFECFDHPMGSSESSIECFE